MEAGVLSFDAPPFCRREMLRYAGAREDDTDLCAEADRVFSEAKDVFSYRVAYREYPVCIREEDADLSFACVRSRGIARALRGCFAVVLFAATVGPGIDRLIARQSRLSPAHALFCDALGSERVEALCDLFCETAAKEKAAQGFLLRPRFSPGYGDIPLSLQADILSALDARRTLGIALGQTLLMSPQKSVTAIAGIAKK